MTTRKKCSYDRWKVTLYSPFDGAVLWTEKGASFRDVGQKWQQTTGNDFITGDKLTRKNLGRLKGWASKIIKIEKISVHFDQPFETAQIVQQESEGETSGTEEEEEGPNYTIEPLILIPDHFDSKDGTAYRSKSGITYGPRIEKKGKDFTIEDYNILKNF